MTVGESASVGQRQKQEQEEIAEKKESRKQRGRVQGSQRFVPRCAHPRSHAVGTARIVAAHVLLFRLALAGWARLLNLVLIKIVIVTVTLSLVMVQQIVVMVAVMSVLDSLLQIVDRHFRDAPLQLSVAQEAN